ncbi:MAG: fibronectin type III domain-containing protein [Deltaproteobacteria bacterium]|nr:fibronectin type III domain-containing protein [Deltaproteobacteria bacterium]
MKKYHVQITSHACPESHSFLRQAQDERHRRVSRLTVFMLIAHCSLLLFISSCGKKLPPVAPESVVPEPVKELKVVSRDSKLLIRFVKPSKNVDGSKITDLAGFRIMRRVIDDKGCRGCPEKFPVVYDIDISYPKDAIVEGDRIAFPDNDLTPGTRYEYKVVTYNKDGYEGPEAQRVIFTWGVPTGKPQNLSARAGDKAVDLSWTPLETLVDGSPDKELAGYNIYRREDGGRFPLDPINSAPVKETSFSDLGLTNGRAYLYTVRALIQVNESLIEGASSDEITVTPKETVIEVP